MEFHINRSLRERLGLEDVLFSFAGNVVFGDVAGARSLANKLNDLRRSGAESAEIVNAGALFAMGLIDELSHAMIAQYRKEVDPDVLSEALGWLARKAGTPNIDGLLLAFTEQFPNAAIFRGEQTAAAWLAGSTEDLSNREAALEELLLLRVANLNPALKDFKELFGDEGLKQRPAYEKIAAGLPEYFRERPQATPDGKTLFEVLREPALASPESITGQLDFIREHWAEVLGEDLRQVLLAIDVIREEDVAIWMRFHPPTPGRFEGQRDWQAHGFVGDEFVGFEDDFGEFSDFIVGPDGVRRRREYSSDHQAPLNEYEAFSADHAWMPTVVMMAKSTYVWLEQLSQKYARHIHRLDQIPDEELALLSERGMTALWLIGLWERSVASQTIKRLRGNADAVASAYSLKEYEIAADLGGNGAYESLRDRAARYGIRLASDMVPNHMGIDSNWVIDHPEWFISRDESPFPVYKFDGPDLANDSRVEIQLEDHYYDQTDAAVAFRLRNRRDGSTRYIYHGNDGTTFAWNDTAQLDYSKAAVREHVIQVILHVARLFPIIRFDAAMVLAKRHVQRLWFPLPGVGGSIPSRAENAMSQEEFDALMPNEFWREVVDRVAVEVPGTLLLAEAFWLLEGYFVRTLGMHRVYNSAFMNMLRDEENAKYRSYLKKTIEFDPDILKRYVNFMSNPDERTAADQFGGGDKYFGTCTLLATLPGLPMFAHGQIEGFSERYGMDFKQARMQEYPNQGFIDRYQREIVPLLKSRHVFAESTHFVLYDFWTENGVVDENVLAYSNRSGDERAIIVYNNVYQSTRGTIHLSAASMDKGSGELRQRSLTEALGLWTGEDMFVAYRDPIRNLEYLRRASDLERQGLTLDLRGYQYVVLRRWRELRSTADQPWSQLHDALGGAGVYSLEEALSKLRLLPVHEALRQVVNASNLQALAEAGRRLAASRKPVLDDTESVASAEAGKLTGQTNTSQDKLPSKTSKEVTVKKSSVASDVAREVEEAKHRPELLAVFVAADRFQAEALKHLPVNEGEGKRPALDLAGIVAKGTPFSSGAYEERFQNIANASVGLPLLEREFSTAWPRTVREIFPNNEERLRPEIVWAPVLAWMVLASFPEIHDRLRVFDQLDLRSALAEIFSSLGIEGENAWRAAARVRILLATSGEPGADSIEHVWTSERFWGDSDVRWLAGISEASGEIYFNKECFEELLSWLQLPALLELSGGEKSAERSLSALEKQIAEVRSAAESAGWNLGLFRRNLARVETAQIVVDAGNASTLK
ncbi:MAG: alpha-amylase family glycosyl hydrolase [Acidobacteriaceae bacterium]